jgi:nucleoside-diphosphate-sugar epimerase
MRVLLAGASGALGGPLTRRLLAAGHEVVGVTRTAAGAERTRAAGAAVIVADVLDRSGLLAAVDGVAADAVVHQLTALKRPPMRHRDMATTNTLRMRGTSHLLEVARAVGASRFVAQSMMFGYGYGDWGGRLLTEDTPFAPPGRGRLEDHLAALRSMEQQTLGASGIDGIALRYALFYGPGTGLEDLVDGLRRRRLPAPSGGGPLSWVYIDDAAAATVAAIERGRAGEAYNVAGDEAISFADFLRAVAQAYGAPPPRTIPRWVLRAAPYAYAAMLRDFRISNDKARRELGWMPAAPTIADGLRAALATEAGAAGGQRG